MDKVLIKIANTITNNFRPEDYVFRLGGDEFAVLMLNIKDDIKDIIKEKVESINAELGRGSAEIPATSVSVGISMCGNHADFESMYKQADKALYTVKESGKHGYDIYEQKDDKKEVNL